MALSALFAVNQRPWILVERMFKYLSHESESFHGENNSSPDFVLICRSENFPPCVNQAECKQDVREFYIWQFCLGKSLKKIFLSKSRTSLSAKIYSVASQTKWRLNCQTSPEKSSRFHILKATTIYNALWDFMEVVMMITRCQN